MQQRKCFTSSESLKVSNSSPDLALSTPGARKAKNHWPPSSVLRLPELTSRSMSPKTMPVRGLLYQPSRLRSLTQRAEMWMGTYPELPSYILSSGEDLQEYMNKNAEELIGKSVIDKFGHTDLPFLPKVRLAARYVGGCGLTWFSGPFNRKSPPFAAPPKQRARCQAPQGRSEPVHRPKSQGSLSPAPSSLLPPGYLN